MVCSIHLILFSLIWIFIFSGCADTAHDREKSYGDSLVIVTYHAPGGINPLRSLSSISAILVDIVFDGLVRIEEDLEARPALASSWHVSDDSLKWTFLLRKNVKFHDGVELTSEDVKFTIEEIIHSIPINPFAGGLADIKSIQIRDRYTVEIILNRPSIFFLYNMDVEILPAHILKERESQNDFGLHPVGTGPFKLSQWKDNEIVFEVNKDYFRGRPYIDNIVARVYPNQELAWARLMRGDGDIFIPVDHAASHFLRQVSLLKQYKTQRLYYSMVLFNNDNGLFNDKEVRRGLNYAIDKEYIIQDVLRGMGKVATGSIRHDSWAYNPSIKPYPYNPQKALSFLKEAGWKDTDGDHILDKNGKRFIFTLLINEGDEIKKRVALYIQQRLWELGILMHIETVSPASTDFLLQGKFDAVFLDMFSPVYPNINYNIWHSSQIRRGFNISRYRSDIVDKLLEKGRLSRDIDDARPIYWRFQQEIYDNPPGIFLYWADTLVGVHIRFRGVRFLPGRLMAYINEWYVPKEEQKHKR